MIETRSLNSQMLRTLLTVLEDGKTVENVVLFKGDEGFNDKLNELKEYDKTSSWKDFYRIAEIEYNKYKFTIGSSTYFYGKNLAIIKSIRTNTEYVLNIDVREDEELFDVTHNICDTLDKFGMLKHIKLEETSLSDMPLSITDSLEDKMSFMGFSDISDKITDRKLSDVIKEQEEIDMDKKIEILMSNMKTIGIDEITDLTNLGNLARILYYEYRYNSHNIELYDPKTMSEEKYMQKHELMSLVNHLHTMLENIKDYYKRKGTTLSIDEYVTIYRRELAILKLVYGVDLNLNVYRSELFMGLFIEDYDLLVYENDLSSIATLEGSSQDFVRSFVMNSEEVTPFIERLVANNDYFSIFTDIMTKTGSLLSLILDEIDPTTMSDEEIENIISKINSSDYFADDDGDY